MVRRVGAATYVTAVVLWLVSVVPSSAQGGVGFHGGGTIDPDQGFFGMHYISNPLSGNLRLQPGADLGFGNDVILSVIHVDFAQWITLNQRWQLYFGGGPAINIYRFDTAGARGGSGDSTTDIQGGFDTIVGFAHESGTTFEMRIGSNGSPNIRFGIGYTFRN